ncbi:phage portal protein, partial [Methylobacterium gnaphalii]
MTFATKALSALAWVAPRAAMARAHALGALYASRSYDGAKLGRRGESFSDRNSSANIEIGAALSRLRNRSRDLARNTSGGRRVLDVKVGHAIGSGITVVPDNGSDAVDRRAGEAFDEWAETSDVEGVLSFGGQQKLGVSGMYEGGDTVLRRVRLRMDDVRPGQVPLKLQVLEGDFIDGFRDRAIYDGIRSRLGVGLGDWDRRLGLWLHPQHPGDLSYFGQAFVSKFVSAEDVIHLYNPLRPGQVRGVPIFAPVLLNARDLADLMDAVLIKAKTEACFSAFVETTGEPATGLGQVSKEPAGGRRLIERLAPGLISYLNPGEKVSFASPTGAGQFEPVWLASQMAFAAGVGL